jgi:phosphate transport system protein
MQPENHTSKQFDAELEQVRSQVLAMGGMVERQIMYAVSGLKRGEPTLFQKVVAGEAEVNQMEREVDELCTTVIARRQPNANDLRLITAALKTITDLERIGDEAKKIARTSESLHAAGRRIPRLNELSIVADIVVDMLQRSLNAFARLEVQDTPHIARLDLDVDEHFQGILRNLLTYMIEDPRTISSAIDLVFIAKSLERIGDHAKNISEYVVYMIKGKDVRHVTLEEMEEVTRS